MRELQDGGAIYGGMKRSVLRENVVRDVVKMGEGYGVSVYYLDEGASDCIVERNVAIDVKRPIHNHIARRLVIRDNVFLSSPSMVLSFPRSVDCVVSGNVMVARGRISAVQPNAIRTWTHNVLMFGGGEQPGDERPWTITDAMPPTPPPARRSAPGPVLRASLPPSVDGTIGADEWPGPYVALDRAPSRWPASGAPAFVKLSWDEHTLYVGVYVATFNARVIRPGAQWGVDDGAQISVQGRRGNGEPWVAVVRGWAGGAMRCVTNGGATESETAKLESAVRFAAQSFGDGRGGWHGEWAIPFEVLGWSAAPGLRIPFNIEVFRAEDGVRRCLEGTLGDSWNLAEAAVLELR